MHRAAADNSNWLEWAVAGRALTGETESGDRHFVKLLSEGALVAVIDGLGHGPDAAAAAQAAVAALDELASPLSAGAPSLTGIVQSCHTRLRQTRGVVASLAWLSPTDQTMTWLGVGDVEGALLRSRRSALAPAGKEHAPAGKERGVALQSADGQLQVGASRFDDRAKVAAPPLPPSPDTLPPARRLESLLSRGGVIGYQLPPLRASQVAIQPGDVLILATDGIKSGFADRLDCARAAQDVADEILLRYRKGTDDALVLVARYRGVMA